MRALMPMLAIKVVPPKSTRMERAPLLMRRKAYSPKGLGGVVVKSSRHNDDKDLPFLTLGDLHVAR